MKLDIWGSKNRYANWKAEVLEGGIPDVNKNNSDIIIRHVFDMENGENISVKNKKGARSPTRLNTIRTRLVLVTRGLEARGIKVINPLNKREIEKLEKEANLFFNEMRKTHRSTGSYCKVWTAFWHWWMKVNRKKGKQLPDITEDLDKSDEEGRFVYLTKEQVDTMLPYFTEDEQLVIKFIFDSIIRSPTELLSLKVKDVYQQK